MVEIISEPIGDRFFNLVTDSKNKIRLCAPYIKEPIINKIYCNKRPYTKVEIISNFSLPNFYNKSSDIEAFKIPIKNKDKVYNCQTLHAKIYIFDDKYTIITSSNLTSAGFERNTEYGIFINDYILVNQTVNDFKTICQKENTGEVNENIINRIQSILENIYSPKILGFNINEHTEADSVLHVDTELLTSNFNNWQKKTFKVINLINKNEFSLSDVYAYESVFAEAFPNNNTIRDSIRRNLQELRDLGLIKFYGNGMYKKLWG
ncbi:MAG: type II deoxyribonuclease [Firmicutes bacterium]|nr:type II deoxyribonuclease [Bacillota bacterium]